MILGAPIHGLALGNLRNLKSLDLCICQDLEPVLQNLPTTLERLRFASSDPITPSLWENLPSSLTALEYGSDGASDADPPDMPSGAVLQLPLGLRSLRNIAVPLDDWRHLPGGLKIFQLPPLLVNYLVSPPPPSPPSLPATLEEFDYGCVNCGSVELPPTIRSLTIQLDHCSNLSLLQNLEHCVISTSRGRIVPRVNALDSAWTRHLVRLSSAIFFGYCPPQFDGFPHLTSLILNRSHCSFDLLPKTLQSLIIQDCDKIEGSDLVLLPPNLTQLHLEGIDSLEDYMLKYLPSSLTKLHLQLHDNVDVSGLTLACLLHLPRYPRLSWCTLPPLEPEQLVLDKKALEYILEETRHLSMQKCLTLFGDCNLVVFFWTNPPFSMEKYHCDGYNPPEWLRIWTDHWRARNVPQKKRKRE